MVHIYTGDGKGKTTAAFGLALRAFGRGLKVAIIQFLKGAEPSGEVLASQKLNLFHIERFGANKFFLPGDKDPAHFDEARKGFNRAKELASSGEYDLVIADEIIVACKFGLLSETDLLDLIRARNKNTELVLTGRGATENLIAAADLVTEMRAIKHYFNNCIPARKGIED
jgi:cob(I)alamin adenosyltransferase